MKNARCLFLFLAAFFELTRYDLMVSSVGVGPILQKLRKQRSSVKPGSEKMQNSICEGVLLATCFYWKPVLCLQRSVCTARLLRKYGIDARLVIGYRPAPFFSHAWVEVDGRVVYGSAAYRQRLQMLVTA